MNELIVKCPFKRNEATGNVSLTTKQWTDAYHGRYDRLTVLRDRGNIYKPIEQWMFRYSKLMLDENGVQYVLMPYSKGSPLYRYGGI